MEHDCKDGDSRDNGNEVVEEGRCIDDVESLDEYSRVAAVSGFCCARMLLIFTVSIILELPDRRGNSRSTK